MHDTLKNPDAKHSSLVPMIHAAFGWDPPPDPNPPAAEPEPSPLLPSADALEMAAMYDQLSEAMKQKLRDDAAFYLSISKSTPERDPDTEN